MRKFGILAGALGLGLLAVAPSGSKAAMYAPGAADAAALEGRGNLVEAGYWGRGPGVYPGRGYGPRYYPGRGYWYHRPWVRRPYYGTIFAGIALGTIITVAAVGVVPRRPSPELCWYWSDPSRSRGYWVYCY